MGAPVDLDLDVFGTTPTVFRKGGVEYAFDGDLDVDDVGRLLAAENAITDAANRPPQERVQALQEATAAGKQLVLQLLLSHDPAQDVATLRLSTQEVLTVFALLMHGGSVAAVIAEAMKVPGGDDGDAGDGVATPDRDGDHGWEGDDVVPLALAASSSERSSGSDSDDDGLRSTGSA